MFSGKTIFIAPIDWGFGHATRCVSLIHDLERNNRVILGVTPLTRRIFDEEFPLLQKVDLPSYKITYSKFLPIWLKLFLRWPRIQSVIKKENSFLQEFLSKNNIDIVISDNRFGFYSKKIHSVFITHQLFLKAPFLSSLAQHINKNYILNFDEVWIPDFEDEQKSLAGKLSHGVHFHKNVKYIGPLSRLQKTEIAKRYDFLALLSGPEPQQSILKKKLLQLAEKYPSVKFAFSIPSETTAPIQNQHNIDFYFSPRAQHLSEIICSSETIICRSGYSSLMDLYTLRKHKMILIPTPGQSEQEYLADYWTEKFNAIRLNQNKIHHFKLKQAHD